LVRERLTQGDSDRQVLDFLVARYRRIRAAAAAAAMAYFAALGHDAGDAAGGIHRARRHGATA